MRAELIDERDAVQEVRDPNYRLVVRDGENAYRTYRLVDCHSIADAEALSNEVAAGRESSLWVEYTIDALAGSVGLARLRGFVH